MLTEKEVIIRLVLAVVLGGLIGLERERLYVTFRTYSAGFRTHILVCVGAAVAMLVSEQLHFEFKGDAARIAAQVVSGIGFLGAGAILREGSVIRGLTTAASLWVVACIGLAAGSGFYLAAALGTFLVLFALVILGTIEDYVRGKRQEDIFNIIVDEHVQTQMIGQILSEYGVVVRRVNMERVEGNRQLIEIAVNIPPHADRIVVLNKLAALSGVYRIEHRGS